MTEELYDFSQLLSLRFLIVFSIIVGAGILGHFLFADYGEDHALRGTLSGILLCYLIYQLGKYFVLVERMSLFGFRIIDARTNAFSNPISSEELGLLFFTCIISGIVGSSIGKYEQSKPS